MSSILLAPAMVLSGKRELVPLTNKKSPALLICGYAPLGVAFPATNFPIMYYNLPTASLS